LMFRILNIRNCFEFRISDFDIILGDTMCQDDPPPSSPDPPLQPVVCLRCLFLSREDAEYGWATSRHHSSHCPH